MSSATKAGVFVVFEGAEGVGKSTQIRRLVRRLETNGVPVVAVREPGGTALGDEIRRLLLDEVHPMDARAEALLFMASRAQLVASVIRPALERGAVVLADRFFLSTYAYQVGGRGLNLTDIQAANAVATDGLTPSLTLLLTLSVDEGLRRMRARSGPDRIESADAAFHQRVSQAFEDFTKTAWQAQHPEVGPVVSIDASGAEQAVADRVWEVLQAALGETISLRSASKS